MKNGIKKITAVFLAAAVMFLSGCLGRYRSYNDIGEAQALALRKAIECYRNDYVSWLLNETDFDLAKYNKIYINRVDEAEESPDTYTGTSYLPDAVGCGNYEAAKMLIEHGCDPKYTDWLGNTTPYLAAGDNEMLKLVLDNGADVQDGMMVSIYVAKGDRESLEWLERDYGLDASRFTGLIDWTAVYHTYAFTPDNPALVWLFERTEKTIQGHILAGSIYYLGDYMLERYLIGRSIGNRELPLDADILEFIDEWTIRVGGIKNNYYGFLTGKVLPQMREHEDTWTSEQLYEFNRALAYMYSVSWDEAEGVLYDADPRWHEARETAIRQFAEFEEKNGRTSPYKL